MRMPEGRGRCSEGLGAGSPPQTSILGIASSIPGDRVVRALAVTLIPHAAAGGGVLRAAARMRGGGVGLRLGLY